MKNIKFGFCIPVYANPGMTYCRTPAYQKLDWQSIKEAVLLSEELGYDSIFVADHLFWGQEGEIWECMSLMGAFAAITKKINIIPIHLCNNFRSPGIVAKAFSTMSHISDGRVELFYDYGWRKKEFEMYGIDFGENDGCRIDQMIEGLEVIRGLFKEDRFSFNGKFYRLNNAICNPKPVKNIPVWMGEVNNSKMLSAIVKYADMFNSMPCSIEAFRKKKEILRGECEKQGRDFSKIGLSLETQILIRESEEEINEIFESFGDLKKMNKSYDDDVLAQFKASNPAMGNYSSRKDLEKEYMIGTPQTIKKKIEEFVNEGVSHFMLWFMDFPNPKGIKLFAKEVING